jgi:hypothetical protein
MRYLLALVLFASCVSPVDSSIGSLAAPSVCLTTGDGTEGSQCCVWDGWPPNGGPAACNNGLWCAWTGGPTQNDGICREVPMSPSKFYEPCAIGQNSCYQGGYCDGTCEIVCQPPGKNWCGIGTKCIPISADGMVGYCVD